MTGPLGQGRRAGGRTAIGILTDRLVVALELAIAIGLVLLALATAGP